jgi:RNA polymerase sigma-70 factor (ECF subfamily)
LRVEDVARAYRVSRATANRTLMKARGLILRGVRQRLEAHLGANTPDMASLLSLVQSQLNVSIRRYLET